MAFTKSSDISALAVSATGAAIEAATNNSTDLAGVINTVQVSPGHDTYTFRTWGSLTAGDLTEGEEATAQTLGASSIVIPTSTVIVGGQITMEAEFDAANQIAAAFGAEASAQIIRNRNLKIMELFSGFSTTLGEDDPSGLSPMLIADAVTRLRETGFQGKPLLVITPSILAHLYNFVTLTQVSENQRSALETGEVVDVFGCATKVVNGVQSDLEDSNGDIWCAVMDPRAITLAKKWDFVTKVSEKPLSNSYELAMTSNYGVAETMDLHGVGLILKRSSVDYGYGS